MNIPTTYRLWPIADRPGYAMFAVWDARVLNPHVPPEQQLDTAIFFDDASTVQVLHMGQAFINFTAHSVDAQFELMRSRKVDAFKEEHGRVPMTPEEQERLNVFVQGLSGSNLDPLPPEA